MKKLTVFCLFLPFYCYSNEILSIPPKFSAAIGKIESNNNDLAVGDRGKSLGRYQIWQICFKDAQIYDISLQNIDYKAVTNKNVADKVLASYLSKYCKQAIKNNDFETMARVWNGGPGGKNKLNTLKYWNFVKKELTTAL